MQNKGIKVFIFFNNNGKQKEIYFKLYLVEYQAKFLSQSELVN